MTQPSSRLNPHRSLVALDGEGSTSTGVASLRGRNGESLHVRVVQSQEREDLNMHRVRWVFTEGSETFQVELRHGRTSGIRKIYVNRQLQERIKSVTHLVRDQGSSHEFPLPASLPDAPRRTARVVIRPMEGLGEFAYQLLIDGTPIQLLDTPLTPGSPGSPGSPGGSRRSSLQRVASFGRSNSFRKGLAAQQACFRAIAIDKSGGTTVGITVANRPYIYSVGVLITGLEPHGLACAAGLHVGDCLLAVNSSPVNTHEEAVRLVNASPDAMQLNVWGMRPSRVKRLTKDPTGETKVGVTVVDNDAGPGVKVESLEPLGLAARSGLRVGDVILSINDTPVYEHGGAIRSVDVATGSFDVVFIPVDDLPSERQLHPMEA